MLQLSLHINFAANYDFISIHKIYSKIRDSGSSANLDGFVLLLTSPWTLKSAKRSAPQTNDDYFVSDVHTFVSSR